MDFWKGEEMGLYSFVIHQDSAWEIMNLMGNLKYAQFLDINQNLPIFQKKFANYIKKCDEAELNLTYVVEEIDRLEIGVEPTDPIDDYDTWLEEFMINNKKDHSSLLDYIHNEVTEFKMFFS